MQSGGNMTNIIKFVKVMIYFLSIFLISTYFKGKPFFILFKFSSLLIVDNIVSHFNNIVYLLCSLQ
ncbi:hypothetical protein MtrunA17_Chr2g0304121 [Medicago truncatula]|uniref:Transmembrane protein n=1 Tax=Medicago truncatula TaxID=3880 RepID=A0A396J6X8_MEDTR|nr:hypothetical protein MtrunA17_Chr2g0304121 [Medicago truncatula]